jgi:hypothetical protein
MWNISILGSIITNYARCTCEIKSLIAMAKAAINKKTPFICILDLNLRKKLVKCYIWSIALYDTKIWTFRKVGQKGMDSFEMWCLRRSVRLYEKQRCITQRQGGQKYPTYNKKES